MVALRKRNGQTGNGQGVHDLQARLHSLKGDFGALRKDMRGLVGDVGDAAGDKMQDTFGGAIRSARDAAGRVEDWGNKKLPRVRKMVRNQPFAACAIALCAGALLGAILFRR